MSDRSQSRASLMLTGGVVTSGFRAALFAAANRAGMTVNEYVLHAAAERLQASGAAIDGLFHPGDLAGHNDNSPSSQRRLA
ncbi:hypothetical protein [Devosia indica]